MWRRTIWRTSAETRLEREENERLEKQRQEEEEKRKRFVEESKRQARDSDGVVYKGELCLPNPLHL